jgi:hypothetical protein
MDVWVVAAIVAGFLVTVAGAFVKDKSHGLRCL